MSLIKQNNIQSKTGKYTIEYREECTLIQKGIYKKKNRESW